MTRYHLIAATALALAGLGAQADELNNASDGGHTHWHAQHGHSAPASAPTGSHTLAAAPATKTDKALAATKAAAARAGAKAAKALAATEAAAARAAAKVAAPQAESTTRAALLALPPEPQVGNNASDGGHTHWLATQ